MAHDFNFFLNRSRKPNLRAVAVLLDLILTGEMTWLER